MSYKLSISQGIGAAYLLSSLLLLVPTPALAADQWSYQEHTQDDPTPPRDRIIKWCNDSGQVRYASANIKLKEYKPCGKIDTTATCDPSGNRFIGGNDSKKPYTYKNCNIGKRIEITNYKREDTDTPEGVTTSSPNDPIKPLSPSEEEQLRKDMKKAKQQHSHNDPTAQVQQLIQGLMGNLLDPNSNKGSTRNLKSKRKPSRGQQQQMVKGLLDQLDPKSRQAVEQFMNRNKHLEQQIQQLFPNQ